MFVVGSLLQPEPDPSASNLNLYGRSGATGSLLDLDLDVGDGSTCPGQVGCASVGVLGVVVGDSGLDGVLGEHGAVHWNDVSNVSLDNLLKKKATYT